MRGVEVKHFVSVLCSSTHRTKGHQTQRWVSPRTVQWYRMQYLSNLKQLKRLTSVQVIVSSAFWPHYKRTPEKTTKQKALYSSNLKGIRASTAATRIFSGGRPTNLALLVVCPGWKWLVLELGWMKVSCSWQRENTALNWNKRLKPPVITAVTIHSLFSRRSIVVFLFCVFFPQLYNFLSELLSLFFFSEAAQLFFDGLPLKINRISIGEANCDVCRRLRQPLAPFQRDAWKWPMRREC